MDCPQKVASWTIRWTSYDAANIPALDSNIISKIANLNLIINPAELYELSDSDWMNLNVINDDKLKEIRSQLEQSKKMTMKSLLFGLRIEGVDLNTAKILASEFKTIAEIRETQLSKLKSIQLIDEKTALNAYRWFRDSFNKKILKTLDSQGFQLD